MKKIILFFGIFSFIFTGFSPVGASISIGEARQLTPQKKYDFQQGKVQRKSKSIHILDVMTTNLGMEDYLVQKAGITQDSCLLFLETVASPESVRQGYVSFFYVAKDIETRGDPLRVRGMVSFVALILSSKAAVVHNDNEGLVTDALTRELASFDLSFCPKTVNIVIDHAELLGMDRDEAQIALLDEQLKTYTLSDGPESI